MLAVAHVDKVQIQMQLDTNMRKWTVSEVEYILRRERVLNIYMNRLYNNVWQVKMGAAYLVTLVKVEKMIKALRHVGVSLTLTTTSKEV